MIAAIKAAAFLICIAIFLYLVIDNYFYYKNRRKNVK